MKKTIVKGAVFALTFIIALIVVSRVMNQGHDNMTMEMGKATLPVVTMEQNGQEYNRLFGYVTPMEEAFMRETLTILGENREIGCIIEPYGREIKGIAVEVRSADGTRLIENTALENYNTVSEEIKIRFTVKDLIDKDTPYSMALVLQLDDDREVRYYTQIIWSENLYLPEKLDFVLDFHEKTFDKEAAKELTRYMETNSALESNQSFHKVNIHSSFKQLTWGNLPIEKVGESNIQLIEIASQTASFVVDFQTAIEEGKTTTYYRVKEYYRVRYTPERMYLLNYERTMTQMPDAEQMYANDKILLGIADENVPMMESADGNVVVFLADKRLYGYNVVTNKLSEIFGFYNSDNKDERACHDEHDIKILDVDEGGNVRFAVYGYMNRGRHEGEVGVQIYSYDSSLNTIEEIVYIPCYKTYSALKTDIEQLLYMNRDQDLYFFMDNTVIYVNLLEKTYQEMVPITQDGSLQVSDNHQIIVWQEGDDIYHSNQLMVHNLADDRKKEVTAGVGEVIRPLGFMGEDIIYGVAKAADVVVENSGRVFYPMYKVCIASAEGELLKTYSQQNIYVTDCSVLNNQITLKRVEAIEDGSFDDIIDDHITNNIEVKEGKNKVAVANTETYERYVQIQTRNTIDSKTIKILTPKEIVFEGGRRLELSVENAGERYYVYGPYGVDAAYNAPAPAVNRATEIAGTVVDAKGERVWFKGNRVNKNQIMAIKAEGTTEEKNSLAVCLDVILKFEGITRNSQEMLNQGMNAMEILQNNMENAQILDLTGCDLDSMLYYVNQDIPVLAILESGEAVLVTGFNEFNVVIMQPTKDSLYKKGMKDSTEWFAQNGNHFVTYTR